MSATNDETDYIDRLLDFQTNDEAVAQIVTDAVYEVGEDWDTYDDALAAVAVRLAEIALELKRTAEAMNRQRGVARSL